MAGADYLFNLKTKDIFLGQNLLFGPTLKIEALPVKIGDHFLGFNFTTNPLHVRLDNEFFTDNLFFIPVSVNIAYFIPVVENKIWVGIQGGGGMAGLWRIENFKTDTS